MELSKEDLELLLNQEWEPHPTDPKKFIRYTQFAGTHELNTDEEIKEELKWIKRELREPKISKQDEFKKDIDYLKKNVKDLLEFGITEDTLLKFYMASCNFGHKRSRFVTSENLKTFFKEAFDEFDNG